MDMCPSCSLSCVFENPTNTLRSTARGRHLSLAVSSRRSMSTMCLYIAIAHTHAHASLVSLARADGRGTHTHTRRSPFGPAAGPLRNASLFRISSDPPLSHVVHCVPKRCTCRGSSLWLLMYSWSVCGSVQSRSGSCSTGCRARPPPPSVETRPSAQRCSNDL